MTPLSTGLRAIFERNEPDFQRRVSTLDMAVTAILAGKLDEPLRASAERDAHKLAGSLGTFGLTRGSEVASELEHRFAPAGRFVVTDGDSHLAELVRTLQRELDGRLSGGDPDDGRALRQARLETGLTQKTPDALSCGRILVVDDDDAVRGALVLILSDAGYDVCGVGSAWDARRTLEHDTIALLLTDVSMPGETGLDLIRFALCEYPETATLLISSLEDPGIAQVAMDFGAYGYLSKPVKRTAVLIGVMNALRRREMEARERAARDELEYSLKQRTNDVSHTLEQLEVAVNQSRVLQAETIHRWAQAAEHRDPGIGGHLKRMSRYGALLAEKLGLHGGSFELASVLHDVGKVAIPDSIVLKRGTLTADERLAMQAHAEIGHNMLRGSCSSVLELAGVIAYTHHEKFDGSGYPRGLSGADIPIEGRIATVADVFDALTSDRVYRPAWTVHDTIEWMRSQSGEHFDPGVLDVFFSSVDEILEIRAALTNEPVGAW
jgi:putative two-component system response regulator